MKSNVSRSCCPNLSPIQRWTNWKSKKEDRLLCCLLFFLSLGFSLLSFCKIATTIYSSQTFNFKPKRQPAASLINVVVPPSHGAGPHNKKLVKVAVPMQRWLDVKKDIASTVIYLISDGSRYMTGTTIFLDGGQSLARPRMRSYM